MVQSEAGPLQDNACGSANANHREPQNKIHPDVIVLNTHEVSGYIDGYANENHNHNANLIDKQTRIPVLSEFLENISSQHEVDCYQMK